jgi:hypothetical protein
MLDEIADQFGSRAIATDFGGQRIEVSGGAWL